jgi:hypothetical protein
LLSKVFFQIASVYQGKAVFIDWKSGLDPAIFVHYSTPSGDKLIHRAPNPVFMPNYPGWGFHKFNPWRERFDQVIRWTLEAGLVEHWKQRTWVRMKQESVNPPIIPTERGTIEPLTLGNLQGAFFLCFLLFAAAIIAIWFEGLGHMVRKAFTDTAAKSKDTIGQGHEDIINRQLFSASSTKALFQPRKLK